MQEESYNSDDGEQEEQPQATIIELKKDVEELEVKELQEPTPEETAMQMLRDGISIRKVVETTGISKYYVEQMKKQVV
ncbi:hypothetical protein P261_00441 [Lachnospiraceae bacterium TWA4]|nr:hypothetical protein P261_00441 [Lachnospiraceae bacterium TWA4]